MKEPPIEDRKQPQLRHEYVAGLRFNSEIQALVNGRWSDLPGPSSSGASGSGAQDHFETCLVQCLAILGRPLKMSISGAAVESEAPPQSGDPGHLQSWLRRQKISVQVEVPTLGTSIDVATAALSGIEAGAVGMLRLTRRSGNASWALVTGVELTQARPRSLLLLDPNLALPWASGYNARLRARSTAAGLIYGGLDGERHMVLVLQMWLLRRG